MMDGTRDVASRRIRRRPYGCTTPRVVSDPLVSVHTDWAELLPESRLVVLLPGAGYTARMPLLHFAALVADHHGWVVREVAWTPDPAWGTQEVGRELAAAIGDHPGPVRVIAKSLGTMAAPYAAARGIDAVWLTPLLQVTPVVDAFRAHPGRQLLIGGSADSGRWDPDVAASLPADVLEIPGADHGLNVPDPVRTAQIHVDVVRGIDRWFSGS